MKKFIFLLFLPLFSLSQNVQWQWAKNVVNSLGSQASNNLCAGDNGEFYLATKDNSLSRIIKFDTGGNELWRINMPQAARVNGIASVSSSFYVAGSYTNTILLGNTVLTNQGVNDLFVAKYSATGNVIWAKRFGGPNEEVANDICTDVNGNIYITGKFTKAINFDTFQLSDTCTYQMFIVKFNSSGNVLSAKGGKGIWGQTSYSEGKRIGIDQAGNIYTVADYNYFKLDTTQISGGGSPYGAFCMAKVGAAGNVPWIKKVFNYTIAEFRDIGTDAFSNVFLQGYEHWTNGGTMVTEKYDGNGQMLWNKNVYSTCGQGWSTSQSEGISVENGSSWIVGSNGPGYGCSHSNFTVLKLDNSGNILIRDSTNVSSSHYHDIIRDSNGDFIVCAYADGNMSPGGFPVNANLFIAKFKEVSIATSFSKQEKSNALKLYPNPGSGIYYLETNNENETKVTVFDPLGNSVFTQSSDKMRQQIDLTKYAKGFYLVEIINNGQKQVKRISHQ